VLDRDLELFLRACKPLLQSRNSAVILSVTRCFLYLGTPEYLESAIGPLVALVRSPEDIQHVALYNIVAIALEAPRLFAKYAYHFLVHDSDPPYIWRLKLEVLTIIFPYCGMHLKGVIINELEHFARGSDVDLVKESVRAIGRCAQSDSRTGDHCLSVLLSLVTSPDEALVSESLTVIRHLIQQDPRSHKQTIIQLAKNLYTTTSPEARASIIWLVGEFSSSAPEEDSIAPDVLRILVRGFADESEVAKQQIVLLGAKVYLHHLLQKYPQSEIKPPHEIRPPVEEICNEWSDAKDPEEEQQNGDEPGKQPEQEDTLSLLWRYILLLARYDTSYDLRDRARLYKALLADPSSTQLASLLLLAPKPVPHAPSPSETRKDLLIGSSTLVIGPDAGVHGLSGYEPIPDWVQPGNEPDPHLREDAAKPEPSEHTISAGERLDRALKEHGKNVASRMRQNGAPAVAAAAAALKNKSLDEWLADEEEESEDEEEESEEEETGSEEEETGSEEETDSEEEEETDSEEEEEETDSEEERETQGLMAGHAPSQSRI
jgi:hypothetical protein